MAGRDRRPSPRTGPARGLRVVPLRPMKRAPTRLAPVIGARAAGPSFPLATMGSLLLIGAIAASTVTIRLHRASDLTAAAPVGPATRAVIFVLDGARPSDLTLVPTPHISDLAHRGVTYSSAWVGQLSNGEPSSNATIATGMFPFRHGVVALEWRDPGSGLVQRPTQAGQVQLGALDQVMEAHGGTPLAGAMKQRYAGARILSAGGEGCANASAAGSWLADYTICPVREGNRWIPGAVTGHTLPPGTLIGDWSVPVASGPGIAGTEGWKLGQQDDWLTRYTIAAMKRTRSVLTIVNYPEIALVAPYLPSDQRDGAVGALVAGIDRDVGRIVAEIRREGVANQTVYLLTSDQAVAPLTIRDPLSQVTRAVTAAGGQEAYEEGGEATLLGLQDSGQAQPVAQAIQDAHLRGVDAIYYKMHSSAAWQYQSQYVDPDLAASLPAAIDGELATMASSESADVVVLHRPGAAAVRPLNGAGAVSETGLGSQWDTQHVPFIVAGHGVVPGRVSPYPARLVDVAPTVEALLGATVQSGDGGVLADALQRPPEDTASAQSASARRLSKTIDALRSRAAAVGS